MKKWIVLLLALVMCLALCACGGEEELSLEGVDPALLDSLCDGNWVYQEKSGDWCYTETYTFTRDGRCTYTYNEVDTSDYDDSDLSPMVWYGTYGIDAEKQVIKVIFKNGSKTDETISFVWSEDIQEISIFPGDGTESLMWQHNQNHSKIKYVW